VFDDQAFDDAARGFELQAELPLNRERQNR
jgi:hypothetical protein